MSQDSLASFDEKTVFSRVQSPSSINLFKQCPRKYYYQYIEKIPTSANIHQIRGNIVHSALEDFFSVESKHLSPVSYVEELRIIAQDLLRTHWKKKINELESLGMGSSAMQSFFNESQDMVANWHSNFCNELQKVMSDTASLIEAFEKLTPRTEVGYESLRHGVRGFVDAIHEDEGKVTLIDYKTSSRSQISDEYKLQLAIYALLYETHEGKTPDYVGVDFLRTGKKVIPVTKDLIGFAKGEVKAVHKLTLAKKKSEYPKSPGPLCKWRTGQCDYYETCFKRDKHD